MSLGRAESLSNLGLALHSRFGRTGQAADLDEAIEAVREALAAVPDGHSDHAGILSNLGAALDTRFERYGQDSDLTEGIEAHRAAIAATSAGDPDGARRMSNLANGQLARFERSGQDADLDEAIQLAREAVGATPDGHPDRPMYLDGLGNKLRTWFGRTGQDADLDEAIQVGHEAVAATPDGHPARARHLSNLGFTLRTRFGRTGRATDLDEAIQVGREAVAATPDGQPRREMYLINLSGALQVRFGRTGQGADLDEAIETCRAAIAATPDGNPNRGAMLSALGVALRFRSARTGEGADLDEAIEACRAAIAATPDGHAGRAMYLTNLGATLQSRFGRTGESADLDEAIEAGQAAIAVTPDRHPDRAGMLSNLGAAMQSRFGRTGESADLDEAIEASRAAIAVTPDGHPDRAGMLSHLGAALQSRLGRTGEGADLDEAIEVAREAVEISSAPASHRLGAAVQWGRLAAENGLAPDAEEGFAAAVKVLPLLAWHGLDRATREQHLADWAGVATDAAAWAVATDQPRRAVELLEQGRSILWSHLLQIRGRLDDLRHSHPDLAARLDELRDHLDDRPDDNSPGSFVSLTSAAAPATDDVATAGHAPGQLRAEARMHDAQEWDNIISHVRTLPGFSSFLTTPPFADLARAADGGTVVIINVSRYRCDALTVTPAGVHPIALPRLTHADAVDHANIYLGALDRLSRKAVGPDRDQVAIDHAGAHHAIDDVLNWLWDTVTEPILASLPPIPPASSALPRVWWCPTGPLTVLPLHAAGRLTSDDASPHQPGGSVLDRVVSSYTPTLHALHNARNRPQPTATDPARRMLLVTMPTTGYLPGGAPLPGAGAEARLIADRFPRTHTLLTGDEATRARVMAALREHSYAHFACHAGIDLDLPAGGGLSLTDGPLTIQAISRHSLHGGPELAFLSACQTALGSFTMLDEAITMAAALQLAGYRHIIATLWTIADSTASDVARHFYNTLALSNVPNGELNLTNTAHALHAAVRHIRTNHPPAQWAPYIHVGP